MNLERMLEKELWGETLEEVLMVTWGKMLEEVLPHMPVEMARAVCVRDKQVKCKPQNVTQNTI